LRGRCAGRARPRDPRTAFASKGVLRQGESGRGGAVFLPEAVWSLRRAPAIPSIGIPQDLVVPEKGRAVRADAGRGRRPETRLGEGVELLAARVRHGQAERGLGRFPGGQEALLQVHGACRGVSEITEDDRLAWSRFFILPA